MDIPNWLDIILYTLTGSTGAAALAILGKKLREWLKMRAFLHGVREIHATYNALLAVQNETSAKRALIFKSENNRGIPQAGCRLYATVVYETYSYPLESMKHDWEKRELDKWYISMLTRLIEHRHLTIRPDEMEDDEQLKDIYLSQGIARSEVVCLGLRDNAFWYLVLNYQVDVELEPHQRESMRAAQNILRRLLRLSPIGEIKQVS